MVVLPQDVFDALNDLDFNPTETRETNTQFTKEFKKQKKEAPAIEEQVVKKQKERIKDPTLSSKEKTLYKNIGKEFFKSSKSVIMKIRQSSIFRDMMVVKDKVMDSWIVRTPLNAAKRVVSSSIFKKAMKIVGMFSLIWLLLQTFFDDVIDNILKKISPYIHVAMENFVSPLINALGNMYRAFESFVLYCLGVEEGKKNLLNLVKEYFDISRSDYDKKDNHSLLGVMYKAIHSIIYDDLNIFAIKNKTDQERDEIQTHIVRFKSEANKLVNTKVEDVQEEINKKRQEEATKILKNKDVQETIKLTAVNYGWKIDGTKITIDGEQYDMDTQALEILEKYSQFVYDKTKDTDAISENAGLRTNGEITRSKAMGHISHALNMNNGDIEKAKSGWKGTEDTRKLYKERNELAEAISSSSLDVADGQTIARGLNKIQEVERHRVSSKDEHENITKFLDSKRRIMGNIYFLENTMSGRNEITSYMLDEISVRDKTLYAGLASLRKLMEGFFFGGGSSGINSFVASAFVNLYTKIVDKLGMGEVKSSVTGVQTLHGKDTKITDTADKENIKHWEMGMEVGYEMEPSGSVLNLITIDTTNHRPLQNALFLFNQYIAHLGQEVQLTNEELLNTISVFKTGRKYIADNKKVLIARHNPNKPLNGLSNHDLANMVYDIVDAERKNGYLNEADKERLQNLREELERRGVAEHIQIEEKNIVIPVLPSRSHVQMNGTAMQLAVAVSNPDS